ncbi:MAG TPA: pilus assembly protein TadG-related protein [Sphingomicrobium sp.]|nr:pilus assembly protein TadG-related protein [Sphingomicrobium sp.]
MIAFLKRLYRDRRGNVLIIAGMTLPIVVGGAGLAVDTMHWVMWKRQLQRAADSAAIAGALASVQDNAGMTVSQAVANDLAKNNTTGIALLSSYPQITFPSGAGFTNGVRVVLGVQKNMSFSSLFLDAPPVIIAGASAGYVNFGEFCVVALNETGPALSIGGSADVSMGCGAISNSTNNSNAVDVNGNSHTFEAEPVAAVGAIDGSINGASDLRPYSTPLPDPFAGLSLPTPTGCTPYNNASKTNADGSKKPGCYNQFNPGNGTTVLSPGVYVLNNTSLNMNGQTRIVGEGVTLILTGTNPGTITMNGSSSLDITAQTTGPYANMAIIGTGTGSNLINGSNNTAIDGAVYFPNGNLTLSGSTAQSFQCAMMVAGTVTFSGSATVQNDTSDCDAAITVAHSKVRLVA